MGKYSTGIDWTTVFAMQGAVEVMHSCRVVWTLTTPGQAQNGSTAIECVAHFAVVPGSDLPKTVTVRHVWPTKTAKTMEGLWYNLLWQLDYAIGKAYEQLTMDTK